MPGTAPSIEAANRRKSTALQTPATCLSSGDRELPKGHLPITCTGGDGLAPAVAYVHAVGDQWASTPGALEWARQCRNVWRIVMMLREVAGVR
jgi:hypothetical protein